MTPTRRRPQLGWIAAAGAVALAVAWSLLCPWLVALPSSQARALLPFETLAAGVVGLAAWRATKSAMALGPQGAVRLGGVITVVGVAAAAALGLGLLRSLGAAAAVAFALAAGGLTICVGLLVMLMASWRMGRRRGDDAAGRSVPLRALMAGAAGLLATTAWALASGHVLGQLHGDAERHALDEARDLVAIVAERALISDEIDAIAPELAPPGGFLVSLDDAGRVVGGVGAGVVAGSEVAMPTADLCRLGHRALPCAVRRLVDGSIVAAAVPTVAIAPSVVFGFTVAGLLVALTALGIGALIGGGTARDLGRVATTLDELGRSPRGLDRPVVALSNDEVGALATALGRLRARLQPGLADYQAALEKAQAADQMRTEFLTLVSAELRNPLDRILLGARTLLDPGAEKLTDEQKEDVRIVLTSATHLVDLIDEVLDISAIATGQVSLKLTDVDVGQLVGDVAKAQRPLVQQKGVEIKIDIESPSPHARADERRLRQVVTNIISNAVKFTDKGSIEIGARKQGDRIVVAVKDTGPGIADEQLPRLFSEFVQLGTLKQRARGTGLGLAICKRLVEAHGGQVTAESMLGQGVDVPRDGTDARARRAAQPRSWRRRRRMSSPAPRQTTALSRVGVLAACVALALTMTLALPWLFQWIMHLSPEEAAYTRRSFLLGAPLDLAALAVTTLIGLRGVDCPAPDERARQRVLALPFRLAVVTVVGGELAAITAMAYDQWRGATPLPIAVGLLLCTSAMIALVAVPLYALARAALVPLAQRHATEAPPRGRPLSLRVQLGYTVFAVATAALVPATVFGMAQLDASATADAHARATKTAARLAASAAELDIATATRLATRTPLAGRERVILRAPSGSLVPEDAAEEVAGQPYVERALGGQLAGGALRVYYAPRIISPVALMAVTLGLLVLALVVASTLGTAVARDARGVAEQIARVAERRGAAAARRRRHRRSAPRDHGGQPPSRAHPAPHRRIFSRRRTRR